MRPSTMLKSASLLAVMFCCTLSVAFGQKYKTLADTAKLNAERNKLTRDIAELNTELNDLKTKLPEYEAASQNQAKVAQEAAQKSKEMAA